MRADELRNLKAGQGLAGMVVLGVALVGIVPSLRAAKGPACEVLVQRSDGSAVPDMIQCNDCDQNCDEDGVTTANKSCTFMLKTCANQTGEGCPVNLKRKIKGKGPCGAGKLGIPGPGTNSACGLPVPIKVKTTKKGKKPGKCKIQVIASSSDKPSKVDVERITLVCNPTQQGGQCPPKTTTTTTLPVCGNGVVEAGEMCDPPCAQGSCGTGMACTSNCKGCETLVACGAACGPTPTALKFTTSRAQVGSGSCATSDGVVTGTVKSDAGATVCNLRSGGLYFGGSGDAVPLPAVVPDLGTSLTKVPGCCAPNGTTVQLVGTTTADVGGTHPNRTCTSAGVANPEYPKGCSGGANVGVPCTTDAECGTGFTCFSHDGCLFGPPLPIPNPLGASLSTCVINRVAKDASGTAACDTGNSAIDLPLISDLYLTGDLLDGSAPNRPNVPGIQPCPICDPASNTCKGGPNNAMPCVAGNTDVPTICVSGTNLGKTCTTDADCPGSVCNHPYPTSHDCPPPPTSFIGPLSIAFALTTGSAQKVSTDFQDSPGRSRVFCGFCGAGVAFHDPPLPCKTDAECAGQTGCPANTTGPCTSCRQRQSGAFQVGDARTITQTGTLSEPLTDHSVGHDSTLVSVFCIPPSFNGAVDGTADLPGPGAVALPGKSQLLP